MAYLVKSTESKQTFDCDIFCEVIDNYGDAGVCWRLARTLFAEKQWQVRLFVSNLTTLATIVPEVSQNLIEQKVQGITICQWSLSEQTVPARLVLETFACRLPNAYEQKLASLKPQPIWINLDYLSAEDWVEEWHQLPSPHPTLPINKYYFYPGFSNKTGGLIFEKDLLKKEQAFKKNQINFLKELGASTDQYSLFVFCYPGKWLQLLGEALLKDDRPIQLLLAPGKAREELTSILNKHSHKNITIINLPFFDQKDFEKILWSADSLIVRGEDSFVRAQMVARPFLWNIYPIEDGAHIEKLEAFANKIRSHLKPNDEIWHDINLAWNTADSKFIELWPKWRDITETTHRKMKDWRDFLFSNGSLIDHLCKFAKERLK